MWLGSLFPRKSQGWIRSCGSSGFIRCGDIHPAQPCPPLLAPPAAPAARGPAAPPTHGTRTLGWLRVGARGTQMSQAGGSGAGWQTHTYKCTRIHRRAHAHVHTHSQRAQAHRHPCTRIHTCVHRHVHMHARTHVCTHGSPPTTRAHSGMHTQVHTHVYTRSRRDTDTSMCTRTRLTHAHVCTRTQTRTHAYARSCMHTHACPQTLQAAPAPWPPPRLPPPQRRSPRQPPCPGSTCPAARRRHRRSLQAGMRGAPAAPPPHCSRAVLCSRTRGRATRDRSTRCRGAASRAGSTPRGGGQSLAWPPQPCTPV